MKQSITFVDIETPNYRNDSISAIALINVDKDGVVTTKYSLVNPETYFDEFNINLTKITPEMVMDAPTFKDLWSELEPYFINSIIVAHNAIFDLSVITDCLHRYNLPVFPIIYACTYRMSRSLKIPSVSFKLNDLSEYYHVKLAHHHHALDDTKACQEIFYHLLEEPNFKGLDAYVKYFASSIRNQLEQLLQFVIKAGFDVTLNTIQINFLTNWIAKNNLSLEYEDLITELKIVLENKYLNVSQYLQFLKKLKYLDTTKHGSIQSLYLLMSILEKIELDKKLTAYKINQLKKWLADNQQYQKIYPFKQLLIKLETTVNNKQIDLINKTEILSLIQNYFNPKLDQIDLELQDQVICLTGNFNFGQKEQLEKLIILKQGIISKSVTKKVDYLIIGNKGDSSYKYGKHGAKINKALMMQGEGHRIALISETKLMKVLGGEE